MITGSRKYGYVVHFRDLEFYDEEAEYFKRSYSTADALSRIKKLISRYLLNGRKVTTRSI
jgi:hypothetical protein